MRVLLLGDFSGLNKNLNDGLKENGIEVTWASNGDVWKKIQGADFEVFPLGNNAASKIYNYIIFPFLDKRLLNYDVVQAVTPMIYTWQINEAAMMRILKHSGRFFINAAGSDCFQLRAYQQGKYKYHIYDDNPQLVKEYDGKTIKSKFINHATEALYSRADGIIPTVPYDYEVPFEGLENLRKTILFPINHNEIEYIPNISRKKVVIFHGISRVIEKGSNYIIEAMKRVEAKHPNLVECVYAERLPYSEYLEQLSRANIVIDQCKGYGYGINACISLAMGKIVMSGAETDFIKASGLYDCPVHNITPSVDQIEEQLEFLIDSKNSFEEQGYAGRQYIIKHHDYISIAKQYVEEWSNV